MVDMGLDKFFPTVVGHAVNKNKNKNFKKIVNKCHFIKKNYPNGGGAWEQKNNYTSCDTYNIVKDKEFKLINDFVNDAVKTYCNQNKINYNKIDQYPRQGWINIFNEGDNLEYHTHANSIISAVYFLQIPDNSACLKFKSPINDMLQPECTELTIDNCSVGLYKPTEGKVVVFRSHVEHMVETHKTNKDRITLAYNFYPA